MGHYCNIALELERTGLRTAAYPFDWVITCDFEKVLELVSTNFANFLSKTYLSQEKNPYFYFDNYYKIHFYHDFDKNIKSFDNQLCTIHEKYSRRIKRLFDALKSSALLIRHVTDNKEIEYINANSTNISLLFKSFNKNNEIIYLCNKNSAKLKEDIKCFYIDEKHLKNPLKGNKSLFHYLIDNVEVDLRSKNIAINKYKKQRIKRFKIRIRNRLYELFKR